MKKEKVDKKNALVGATEDKEELFHEKRRTVQELISMEGCDSRALEFFVRNDGGVNVYSMGFYIHKMSKNTMFATTFAPLFNFPGVTSSVFIKPLGDDKSQQVVDKRVRTLDTELGDAHDSRDPNRIRKMTAKYQKAQAWADKIENGDNSLYSVQFLFILSAYSEEELYRMAGDFRARALQRQIEVVSCYALETEALLSSYPMNRVVKYKNVDFIKAHVFDKGALGDIFNHTSCSFIHEKGVFLGHYLRSRQAFLFDPFDKAHDGYGAIFAGGTGTGKSATIKMLQSRLMDFGYRFRTLDMESRSTHGEYSFTAEAGGGVNFEIKANSNNTLNPFDIHVEIEFDESSNVEYPVLKLSEKKAYLVDLFLSMVKMGSTEVPATLDKAMTSILGDVVNTLYSERQIYDGNPESLYQAESDNFLSSGRSEKLMPTITDMFKKLLIEQRLNDNELHREAYQLIVDTMKEQVREVYYGKQSLRFFSKEVYESLEIGDYGRRYIDWNGEKEQVIAVIGTKSYFDGQSTLKAGFETPYINYDMSQIPDGDREFALLVLLGYMEENDIKRNSANPLRTTPMITLVDELHILFPYAEARRCIERFYRTARKRWVGPWVATQSIADFGDRDKYPELAGIYKNTDTYFIFRHKTTDREFLKKNTELTDSQIERVFTLGADPKDPEITAAEKKRRTGEICVIDRGRVAFIKADYLENSEARFVETNVEAIRQMKQRDVSVKQ